jgi:hypothetical protein
LHLFSVRAAPGSTFSAYLLGLTSPVGPMIVVCTCLASDLGSLRWFLLSPFFATRRLSIGWAIDEVKTSGFCHVLNLYLYSDVVSTFGLIAMHESASVITCSPSMPPLSLLCAQKLRQLLIRSRLDSYHKTAHRASLRRSTAPELASWSSVR